jgi:hypothetical protein
MYCTPMNIHDQRQPPILVAELLGSSYIALTRSNGLENRALKRAQCEYVRSVCRRSFACVDVRRTPSTYMSYMFVNSVCARGHASRLELQWTICNVFQ